MRREAKSRWKPRFNGADMAMSREEIYSKVQGVLVEALGVDEEQVKPNARLRQDLGAESIDFLDIVFRLERAFKVKIPRGKLIEDARGDLSEAEFEKGGAVTDAGFQRLKTFLNEVPADRFKSPLKVADIPRLFTVETFCKIVIRQQKAAGTAAPIAAQTAGTPTA